MDKPGYYENYPLWIVEVSNLVSILIYILGSFIIYQFGLFWLGLYILYILFLEARLLRKSCTGCYYYGKRCAFGKGKVSSLLFSKGSAKLSKKQISWKDIIPDFMVSLIPIVAGIFLMATNFSWAILVSVALLLVLMTAGNGFVRGSLACRYCKQRRIGCPASRLFEKK